MEARDVRGQIISIGSYARYGGTGTVGQVSDIKEEYNTQWAKFSENSLWYSLDTLEVIKKEDIKKYSNNKSKKVKNNIDITNGGINIMFLPKRVLYEKDSEKDL